MFDIIYWHYTQAYRLRDKNTAPHRVGLGFVRRFLARPDVRQLSPTPGRGIYGVGIPTFRLTKGGVEITANGIACVYIRDADPFLAAIGA